MKINFSSKFATILLASLFVISFSSCDDNDEDDNIETKVVQQIVLDTAARYAATINMSQLVNDSIVVLNTSGMPYSNKLGQNFNLSKLRYLVSDISFHKADGTCFTINEYHLVDVSDANTFVFSPTSKVPEGNYTKITFNFGFDTEDNQSGIYGDLNAASWQWPMMLGSGYHFMQMEGMYDSSGTAKPFATHMGTARNLTATDTTFEDNHFEARLANSAINITADFSFGIVMNVEQWYEAPYDWDFNIYNIMIMPNYAAQRKLNLNGPSVFTVKF